MVTRISRWACNLLAVIAILWLIFIPVHPQNPNKIWIPYLLFALCNWLFADLIFRYIPTGIKLLKQKMNIHYIFDFVIAVIIACIIFKFSARYLFDDAGYVLRYVENFKHGHFYQFNKGDSPVFGLSVFGW